MYATVRQRRRARRAGVGPVGRIPAELPARPVHVGMGQCNGGGGRRHGGGGWQAGQGSGQKSGKQGHGRSGGHEASTTAKREPQKTDKARRTQ